MKQRIRERIVSVEKSKPVTQEQIVADIERAIELVSNHDEYLAGFILVKENGEIAWGRKEELERLKLDLLKPKSKD